MPTYAALRNTNLTSAVVSFTSTGDNTVIAAVANNGIRIYKLFFTVSTATNIIIKNGSTALTGTLSLGANGGFTVDSSEDQWFLVSVGNGFVINQSGTATVGGMVWYEQP